MLPQRRRFEGVMVLSILAFIVVLGVLIVIHEAGHFLAARAVGAPVEVFSVGFGKRLWGFSWRGTDYRLSLIPFGGYVRVVGLGPDESDVVGATEGTEPVLLPRFKRALVLVAGPLTNIVAAVLFLALAFMVGVEVPRYRTEPAVVGWLDPDSPAERAGIRRGDLILALDGDPVSSWRDLEGSVSTAGGRTVDVLLERDDQQLHLTMTPESVSRYGFGYSGLVPPLPAEVVRLVPGAPAERAGVRAGDRVVAVNGDPVDQFWDLIRLLAPLPGREVVLTVERAGETIDLEVTTQDQGGEGKVGIVIIFPTEAQRLGPVAAIAAGFDESVHMTRETFRVLGKLLTRKVSIRQVSGPIDIARISGEAAKSGLHTLVWLMGLISLQLGIFNLLPIPVLDGGHLTILAFESLRRRDLPIRVKERVLEVGFYLLLLLMVVVLFNDIAKVLPDSLYQRIFPG